MLVFSCFVLSKHSRRGAKPPPPPHTTASNNHSNRAATEQQQNRTATHTPHAYPRAAPRVVERVVQPKLQRRVRHDFDQRDAEAAVQTSDAVRGRDAARRVEHAAVHLRLALRGERGAQQVERVGRDGAGGASERAAAERHDRAVQAVACFWLLCGRVWEVGCFDCLRIQAPEVGGPERKRLEACGSLNCQHHNAHREAPPHAHTHTTTTTTLRPRTGEAEARRRLLALLQRNKLHGRVRHRQQQPWHSAAPQALRNIACVWCVCECGGVPMKKPRR